MSIRTVFFGTPDFALPTLQALIDTPDIEVVGVLTQPDRPAGRGNKLKPTSVKELALRHGLDLLQPEKLKDSEVLSWLERHTPDVIVVVAFGGFIPKQIREFTRHGCINLHPSLLPRYRGAAPMQWAIMNGDTVTGNTTMYLSGGWDNGDIIYQVEEPIFDQDSYGALALRLAEKGAHLMVKTLRDVSAGIAPRISQGEEGVVFAPLIQNEDARIKWNRSVREIHNLVRGLSPIPGAFTLYQGERLKIYRTAIIEMLPNYEPGTVITTQFNTIRVAAEDGVIEILELQPSGKKPMAASEFLRGHPLPSGSRCE